MIALEIIFVFIFGAIIGSFLNVLILRLPREESVNGRSHCMHCRHPLAPKDLVPFFSYLFLGGKCAYCNKKISPRYFIIEGVTGLLFALVFYKFDLFLVQSTALYLDFLRAIFITSVLILVFMIDLEHFLILDKIIYPATIVLFLFSSVIDFVAQTSLYDSSALRGLIAAFGLFAFFGTLYLISNGRWIGFGDVKFTFFLGLATPFPIILPNIFLSFMFGSVVGIFLIAFRKRHLASRVPFGVFLSTSTMVTLLWGQQIWQSYLNLIGWR